MPPMVCRSYFTASCVPLGFISFPISWLPEVAGLSLHATQCSGQTGEIRSRCGRETVAEFIGKQKERLLPDPFPLNFNLAASLQTLFAHKARSHFGQDSLHPLPLTTFPDYKTAKYTRRRRRSEPSQLLETWDRSWRSSHRSYLSLTSLP